ncbi:ROS1 protein [Nymphaea thermarum]|nr:ROS1 protein [Nymphaea thermarum]
MDEGDGQLLWLRSLGISATLHNQRVFEQNAGSAEPSSSVSTITSHWDGVQALSLPAEDGTNWQRQVYENAAAVGLGWGSHGASDAYSFGNSGSIAGNVLQSSFPAVYHPQNSNGWHQNDFQHPFLNALPSLSSGLGQHTYGLETNGRSNYEVNFFLCSSADGFPFPYRATTYSIQSPPFKVAPNSSTSEAFSGPVAPVTPEKTIEKEKVIDSSKVAPADISKYSNLFTDERVHQERQKDSPISPPKVCNDNQNEIAVIESLKSHVDSQESVTHSPVRESIEYGKADADGIDLNKTPRQKPKRKKIRPKVVREGKPKRTPKKVEVKQTPEGTPVESKGRLSTGGRTRKPRTSNSTDARESDSLQIDATRIVSCKRSLNFDVVAPTLNDQACLQPEAGKSGPLHQHPVEEEKVTAEEFTEPATFDLNHSLNHVPESQPTQPENPCTPALKRKASSIGCWDNMAQKKNNTVNLGIKENRQEILSTMMHNHIPASMTGYNLSHVYNAVQMNERMTSTTSENSRCSANVENNLQGPLADVGPEASHRSSTGLIQTHLKHGEALLEFLRQHMRQTHANFDSTRNQNIEMMPHELHPYWPSTSIVQEPCGRKAEGYRVVNTNHPTVSNCEQALVSQDSNKEEKQKVTEANKCIHDENSSPGSRKQQNDAKQNHHVQDVLECNNVLGQVEGKREQSLKKEPNHIRPHCTLYFSSATPSGCTLEYNDCRPNACPEGPLASTPAEKPRNKRIRKRSSPAMTSAPSITLGEHETCTHQGRGPQAVSSSHHISKPGNLAMFTTQFVNDCHSSSNLQDKLLKSSPPQAIPSTDPLDQITQRLKRLDISKKDANWSATVRDARDQNAIVPYVDGTMVPYVGSFEPVRRRRSRPKVDLDLETNRVWNLLMGSATSGGIDGTDAEKAKWWEEERKVFRGRVDSFIARMHLIQGDRRFSQWKGSVVDSVVGVFLTQNVSDHLSSSAFMAMAAHFPKKEATNCATLDRKDITAPACVEDLFLRDLHDINTCMDKPPSIENVEPDSTSLMIQDSKCKGSTSPANVEPDSASLMIQDFKCKGSTSLDTNNKSESCGSTAPYKKEEDTNIINPTSGKVLQGSYDNAKFRQSVSESRGRTIGHEDGNLRYFSAISSHNSSDSTIQATDQISSSPESIAFSEEFIKKGQQVAFHQPSFSELLSMAESPMFKDLYSTGGLNLLREDNIGKACNHLQQENWRTHVGMGASSGSSVETGNNPVVYTITNSLLPEATSCITTLGTRMLPHGSKTDFPVERCHTLEPTKPNELWESNCTAELSSLNSSSKAKEAADMHSSEHKVPVNSQRPMGKQVEVSYQGKTIGNGNKSTTKPLRSNKGKGEALGRKEKWEPLRQQVLKELGTQERSPNRNDSLDWEAVRRADVNEIAQTIKERGMNNMLAERIRAFLDRLVEDHGSIDLEWLRNVPPDKSKDFLLSINGLGLKSVECVRLLTLHHLAFPVDTNVGRISVRLGWVPLQPLPESLQLHLLELYPILETIQKYLWPRLCKLDQRTLYELHYQLITFGKVFCTKSRPNCNACPMRGECKHFASAFASARLALPAPEERSIVSAAIPAMADRERDKVAFQPLPSPVELFPSIEFPPTQKYTSINTCEPIIEEPATPEPEFVESSESAIEDFYYDDPDEIPTIKLNLDELTSNIKSYIQNKNMELQESDMSKALVVLTPDAASIPTPKLKNVSRLRTEHQVYELPDDHPLIEGLDKREPDDPCFYLLAIWTPGETAESIDLPSTCCEFQSSGGLCDKETCFSCNAIRETNSQTVRGTLLIPCRTAMRGSFPLNGTYFQVNEVFADHESSLNPIGVPRKLIWNLPRRTVYFGTSVTTIFRGMTTERIQQCFWRGFVCVRGFDQKNRAPRPLMARLHFPASKQTRNKKATAKDLND